MKFRRHHHLVLPSPLTTSCAVTTTDLHCLARRPGCSPKEIFSIIHEKLPTVSTPTISILLSTYAKILMHSQPPDPELQNQIWAIFSKKGAALMDILAEMPKFPERESSLIKKAEDTEADTAELSAIKLRAQQQASNALVVTDQRPVNEAPQVSQLGMVKIPVTNNGENNSLDQEVSQPNGIMGEVEPQAQPPAHAHAPEADILGDLLSPLAIEGPPGVSGIEGLSEGDALALAPVVEQENGVKPIGDIAERFHALCLKDSGVLYEDPYVQVQCPLEVVNLRPSRDVAVLDFSYKFGTTLVDNKLRLPAVLNKFFQPIPITAEEFFPQWRSLAAPPLKLQEVVRGVRPMSLGEMASLLNSWRLIVCPGLDPNPSNLVATTTFYSETTQAMLCLVRIETDPADRTQLRMTVASGDPTLTFELKEFIKEQLISIPTAFRPPVSSHPQPNIPSISPSDPGALLAGLL
nr:AP-2 complex subunit alpha-1-like isoform X2 [Tanacetum cinerariifolium]